MNVLVIGAAGKTGRAVVEEAMAAGHEVTAFIRQGEERQLTHVRIALGDATSSADVDAAIRGKDAVIDTIGGKTPYRKRLSNKASPRR